MSGDNVNYYLPDPTKWPVISSLGLFLLDLGFINQIHSVAPGPWVMLVGALVIVVMMFSWFGQVAGESEAGRYDHQVDTSFRMGMGWFIFSEVMFFGAFFGALLIADRHRGHSLPLKAGGRLSKKAMTPSA